MITRLRVFLALAAICATSLMAAPARAAFPEAKFWKSPASNVPALMNNSALHYLNGTPYWIRQPVVQWSGWTPPALPPPGTPGPGPSFWARITGIGTTEVGLGTFGVDSTRNEMQFRCQTTMMVEPAGGSNSMLYSASPVSCGIYTHASGQTYWTGYAYGTIAVGGLLYRSIDACGVATGCWTVTVNLASGSTFVAWIN